jgi:glycosyltransferase involved in cell wall biosynthesis
LAVLNSPLVSIVIPVFNQAGYLGRAIQSVLDQGYPNFEIIVVNDDSPDNTSEVVSQVNDRRIKYIIHEKNRGLPATRNTGMRESNGEFIALLDADDFFHPDKLQLHVEFLNSHQDVGVTYNARFNLNHSAETIRELYRPPLVVDLADFVLGYPFAPSDMMIRREVGFKIGLFDENYVFGGEDIDFPCRLALSGCKFACINRPLNYRRYHSERAKKNLPCRLDDVIRALNTTFDDPRCPDTVLALREIALKYHLMILVFLAFDYEDTDLGQSYIRQLVSIDASILEGDRCELVENLLRYCIADENRDHELLLKKFFAQLPPELAWLSDHYDWAASLGFLLKGTSNIMWGRTQVGRSHIAKAVERRAVIDTKFVQELSEQLLSYEREFGAEATQEIIDDLTPYLKKVEGKNNVRKLYGCYWVNWAFYYYREGQNNNALKAFASAIAHDPTYLLNRGVLVTLLRSVAGGHLV